MQIVPLTDAARKPGRRVRCPRCEGVGREGKGLKRRPCVLCEGSGRLTADEGGDVWELDVFAALLRAGV